MNKMFEELILKTAEIIAEKNKFKEKYEFEVKGCNQLKQSLNEYKNKVDDLLLDFNNLKDDNILLKDMNKELVKKNEVLQTNLTLRIEEVNELSLKLDDAIENNTRYEKRIRELENALDYANGDYIVEEEN